MDGLTPNVIPSSSAVTDEPAFDTRVRAGSCNIYAVQVRAFLDASEDVETDAETLADILEGVQNVDGEELGEDAESSDEDRENEDETIDISALFEFEKEAEHAWTKQEVKSMMHHLKERGEVSWIKEYVISRNLPIPKLLYAFGICLCKELRTKRPRTLLYFLRVALSRELRLREKLPDYNTIADAINLIRTSKRVLILTGAGISVSCGIPDFRSRDGVYASLKDNGQYDLDDPQQMFDINYFKENPSVFYQIYPSNFIPSPCHRFIKLMEDKGKLLRNYTQNIDTLETLAGVKRVLQCHGSFATATCLHCRKRVPGKEIEKEILGRVVPICAVCQKDGSGGQLSKSTPLKGPSVKKKVRRKEGQWDSDEEDESDSAEFPPWIMKPDITFFGEKLTNDFDHSLLEDREKVDLLLVIGTSLNVSPVSEILSHLPHSVPQILINKTPVRHINPDIILLGDADNIVSYLCLKLGWELPPPTLNGAALRPSCSSNVKKRPSADILEHPSPQQVGNSHVWLFEGADGGKWLQRFKLDQAKESDESSSSEDERGDNLAEQHKSKKFRTK